MLRTIYVYAGWLGNDPDHPLIGTYLIDREKSSASFSYSNEWLLSHRIEIDPALPLFEGRQYIQFATGDTFGFLSDSSPDRWGRGLLLRNEQLQAREERRRARTLLPEDFLLGVSDYGRSGGLRFKTKPEGPFLSVHNDIPRITELRRLEYSINRYEDARELLNDQWVKDLLSPGSSLGGARPKANVIDTDGSLWIAKFPSQSDYMDIGAWEQVSYCLARRCGINVPDSRVINSEGGHHIFLSKRFDRAGSRRIHFISAMTALQEKDSTASASGKGFLDMAEFLAEQSLLPAEDLEELFRRVVFTICISNTDCHFRNHAFLLRENGYNLAPAYDLNPSIDKGELAINITDSESAIDLSLVRETAGFYQLTDAQANNIINDIRYNVARYWPAEADKLRISAKEKEYMSPAFAEASS